MTTTTTDIIKRLRAVGGESWNNPAHIRNEAANEIEQLRAELDALRARIEEMEQQKPVGWFARIDGDGPLMECKHADISRVPLYFTPGAKGE